MHSINPGESTSQISVRTTSVHIRLIGNRYFFFNWHVMHSNASHILNSSIRRYCCCFLLFFIIVVIIPAIFIVVDFQIYFGYNIVRVNEMM